MGKWTAKFRAWFHCENYAKIIARTKCSQIFSVIVLKYTIFFNDHITQVDGGGRFVLQRTAKLHMEKV